VALQPPQKKKNPAQDGLEEIPATQSEWEALLLKNPDFKATEKFVKYYRSNVVNEAVFYSVVEKMLKDSRQQMQQLGVYSLGATPSVKSFDELSIYASNENTTAAAQSKTTAQQFITGYANYLRLLGAVLQSSSSSQIAQINALHVIRTVTDKASQPASADPTQSGVGTSGVATVPKAQISQLVSLIPVLRMLSESGVSEEIKSEAASLQSSIASLAGVDMNPPVQTASVGG
jgi:hypothetical protein